MNLLRLLSSMKPKVLARWASVKYREKENFYNYEVRKSVFEFICVFFWKNVFIIKKEYTILS